MGLRFHQPIIGEFSDFAQLTNRGFEVIALAFEQGDAFIDFLGEQVDLLGAVGVVKAEIVGNIAQREAEPLAAQDEDEASPVAAAENAGGAHALGREQAFGFVEANGAGGDAELLGEVGNGEKVSALDVGGFHFVSAFI